jgi:hypothetical protein
MCNLANAKLRCRVGLTARLVRPPAQRERKYHFHDAETNFCLHTDSQFHTSDSDFIVKDSSSALTSGFHGAGDEGGSGGRFNDDVGGGGMGGSDDKIGKNSSGTKVAHAS